MSCGTQETATNSESITIALGLRKFPMVKVLDAEYTAALLAEKKAPCAVPLFTNPEHNESLILLQ